MDGFTGFKTAAAEELPDPAAVVDPFHVVRLAGEAVDRCRQRVQQDTCGHRGRRGDPLYQARPTLLTGADLLTDKQATRLEDLFAGDDHVEVEATWGIYQRLVQAYRCTDPGLGSHLMASVIEVIATGVPAQLTELVRLGHTLKRRATDILAFFDHSGTSNVPTEALCESGFGWSGTGWSGWRRSCRPGCDSRSNWPACGVFPLNCPLGSARSAPFGPPR